MPLTRFQRCLRLTPFVLAILLTLAAIWAVRVWMSDVGQHENEKEYPYGTLSELSNPEQFKLAYLRANGGRQMLKVLQSVKLTGRVETEEANYRFASVKMRPDRMLLSFQFDTHDITYGINGDVVWRRIRADGVEPKIEQLGGDEAEAMLGMGRFFGPVLRICLLEEGRLDGIEVSEWDGDEVLKVLLVDGSEGTRMEVYVDPQTMFPVARVEYFSNQTTRKTLFGDYHVLSGMQEPFWVESYVDDVFKNRVIVERGDSNFGTISSLFEMPLN